MPQLVTSISFLGWDLLFMPIPHNNGFFQSLSLTHFFQFFPLSSDCISPPRGHEQCRASFIRAPNDSLFPSSHYLFVLHLCNLYCRLRDTPWLTKDSLMVYRFPTALPLPADEEQKKGPKAEWAGTSWMAFSALGCAGFLFHWEASKVIFFCE